MKWCVEQGIPHSQLLEWGDDDRAKLTAWLLEDAAKCDRCGTASWEWAEDRFAYSASTEVCEGCLRLDAAADSDEKPQPGSRIVLLPRR